MVGNGFFTGDRNSIYNWNRFFLYILLQAVAAFRTANGLFVKGQYRPLITAILNIIFSVLLIQKYGIFGTIFATVVCRIVTQWYDPYLLYKHVFHKKFLCFYRIYWGYLTIFLSGSILTYYISIHITVSQQIINFFAVCYAVLSYRTRGQFYGLYSHLSADTLYLC